MQTTENITIAKQIQRQTGPTFHVATRFLPKRVRYPTYVLYAFFRKADQVVDDPNPEAPADQLATLANYEAALLDDTPTDDPVIEAMSTLVDEHTLDHRDIEAFIEAMRRDVYATDYETYQELEGYMRGSAVAVGNMMLDLMDSDATEARPNAKALGEAFQLTNFLRDVREDLIQFDRVYLPIETLEALGTDIEAIRSLEFSPAVEDAIKAELEWTETRYRKGVAGIKHLPDDCQFPVLLAAVFYAEYHRLIADIGYDVLSSQPSLSKSRYLTLLVRTWLEWKRQRDPEAVFYRVSPIDPQGTQTRRTNRDAIDRFIDSVASVTTELRTYLPATRTE